MSPPNSTNDPWFQAVSSLVNFIGDRSSRAKKGFWFGCWTVAKTQLSRHMSARSTSGELCSYRWSLGNFTCDAYCCDPPETQEHDICAVCFSDGFCYTRPCAPAISQPAYVIQKIWQSSAFVGTWIVLVLVLLYARAACRANAAERRMMMKAIAGFVLAVLFMFALYAGYLFTDCRQEFRGISDVCLAISFLGLFNFFISLLRAIFIHAVVPRLDRLLEIIAEAGNRGDERNLLILEVGEDRLRSFWQNQLQEDPSYSRTVRLSCPWLTYCSFVILAAVPFVFVFLYGGRSSFFLCILWCQLSFQIAWFYISRWPKVLRWLHRRAVKAQLAKLPPKESVVLFHNIRSEGWWWLERCCMNIHLLFQYWAYRIAVLNKCCSDQCQTISNDVLVCQSPVICSRM